MPYTRIVLFVYLFYTKRDFLNWTEIKCWQNYQLWPKFLLNAVALCCTHHSYRKVTGLHYTRSKVSDMKAFCRPCLCIWHFSLRLLNIWSIKVVCRNSDCKSQRTESVCLTKTIQLKLLREIIDAYCASHVHYEHLHIYTVGKLRVWMFII